MVKDIAYVELAHTAPSAALASFMLRRFVHETFRPPVAEVPHRHNYQELFIVQSGHGVHAIDGQATQLLPRTVSLITKGQVHIVEHLTYLTGSLIRFSDDFLAADILGQQGQYQTALFQQLGPNHTITIDEADLAELASIAELLAAEWAQASTLEKERVLRHLLAVLLIKVERIFQAKTHSLGQQREANQVYQRFVTLLEQAFARHHDVRYYAGALGVSTIKLSRSLATILGKTTKQVIDERIVLEAKRLLHYTAMSITDIALALGYSDPFHLSKTFKRIAGLAPQAFRDERQKMT